MENKYEVWMNYEDYKRFSEYAKYLERKWWAEHFYGIHPGQYPKFEEFQSGDKSRRISLKDSGKVPEGTRHPALLRKQERDNLLQDSPLRIPSGATFTITLSEPWDKARKDWYSFCETNEG